METRKRNQRIITAFLLSVVGFTCLMTFYAGPKMMALRDDVEQRAVLYKCQTIVDGDTLEVQLRHWRREDDPPIVQVHLAGLDAPPHAASDDPELLAWAEAHKIDPELAAEMGEASHNTLLAFIRKQNLLLHRADGKPTTESLPPDSRVHVFVSGTHVNLKQLQNGLAAHDSTMPQQYADEYREAESKAQNERLGIWRATAP